MIAQATVLQAAVLQAMVYVSYEGNQLTFLVQQACNRLHNGSTGSSTKIANSFPEDCNIECSLRYRSLRYSGLCYRGVTYHIAYYVFQQVKPKSVFFFGHKTDLVGFFEMLQSQFFQNFCSVFPKFSEFFRKFLSFFDNSSVFRKIFNFDQQFCQFLA